RVEREADPDRVSREDRERVCQALPAEVRVGAVEGQKVDDVRGEIVVRDVDSEDVDPTGVGKVLDLAPEIEMESGAECDAGDQGRGEGPRVRSVAGTVVARGVLTVVPARNRGCVT